ncbi:Rpn family recombination-promoting nuclease/putative transposase [Myxacorys almedinensis]|uniref:Flagellar assembly protein H n=1 Tax=Myxacorys almedinensis A TaxID=2690445 RepID=A0A8J7ZB80_9CYAN|nr:Rpn family recombination-promoting nuclease/putative transposase [Myxacorys almedinensis]NDJ19753.1 flagellar assembly protein H [Myxacorys almedinensis A]
MSFDTTCRRLAEQFPEDFASWLLGYRVPLTELSPTELSIEPIRADSVILLQGQAEIVHIEFQTDPKDDVPMRLADYRLRLHRRFLEKTIHQVVLYLRETNSERVYQNCFEIAGMYAEFNVIRIWEVPAEDLMAFPGLLPFVGLSRSDNPIQTLRRAVREIQNIVDESQQHEAMAATYVLSGLKFEAAVIGQIIRRDVMRESVTYPRRTRRRTRGRTGGRTGGGSDRISDSSSNSPLETRPF